MNEQERQTVLVVDDAPENIKIIGELLKTDYKIRVATSGEKALTIAMSDDPPDLVLLDVMMPGMDGYEVCKRLKADPSTKNVPVIFITAKDQEADETKGFDAGGVDYIAKPFSAAIVKARVRTHAELKKHRDYLANRSLHDGLTGIANRRQFDEYLAQTWDFATREFSTTLSLIMMDIDHFKLFNDNYGHQAGDDCLKKVAQTLTASLKRKIDIVARYGGEEFVCILPKTPLNGAVMMANKFRESVLALQIPHAFSSACGFVSISQGVATIMPKRDLSSDILIKAADEALYKSKETGRNKVCSTDLNLR